MTMLSPARRIFLIFSLLLLPLAFVLAGHSHAWTGQVVGVTDGDTIKVLHDGQQVKIRLYGIDTPEKKQAFGQKAKEFTASMAAGHKVDVDPIDTDRYGRIVGIVTVGGENLNSLLVKNGFAWVYPQYCKRTECEVWLSLESAARASRLGLWADPNPVPPWKWRKESKKGVNP